MRPVACRGQGAMEYLMTYGWAILVVVAVGISMWRLGVFNIGSSAAPTESGFAVLKPLLPTCRIEDGIWGAGSRGFICQFVNGGGAPISPTQYMTATVNGHTCQFNVISETPQTIPSFLFRLCDGTVCSSGVGNFFSIPSGGQFTVKVGAMTGSGLYCDTAPAGEVYDVQLSIPYTTAIGGTLEYKSSSGTIRLRG
jgi:hypothetical protein